MVKISRRKWSDDELFCICVSYLKNIPAKEVDNMLDTGKLKSIMCRYNNCKFLHEGYVAGAFPQVSRQHWEVWQHGLWFVERQDY